MDGCETSMYISGEGDNDPNSQENVTWTRGFVNRPKNKGDVDKEKEKEKEKEKASEKVSNEKVSVGASRKLVVTSSIQITYNFVEDISKLRITLPFTEVPKIPQQRKNILMLLDDP